jgi:hypothetical protein
MVSVECILGTVQHDPGAFPSVSVPDTHPGTLCLLTSTRSQHRCGLFVLCRVVGPSKTAVPHGRCWRPELCPTVGFANLLFYFFPIDVPRLFCVSARLRVLRPFARARLFAWFLHLLCHISPKGFRCCWNIILFLVSSSCISCISMSYCSSLACVVSIRLSICCILLSRPPSRALSVGPSLRCMSLVLFFSMILHSSPVLWCSAIPVIGALPSSFILCVSTSCSMCFTARSRLFHACGSCRNSSSCSGSPTSISVCIVPSCVL